MIVERLFSAAELHLGKQYQQIVRILRADGRPRSRRRHPAAEAGREKIRPEREIRLKSAALS